MELPGRRVAILIGIALPERSEERNLSDERLRLLRTPLLDSAIGGYGKVQITINESYRDMSGAVLDLCADTKRGDTLLIFVDAHGDNLGMPYEALAHKIATAPATGVAIVIDGASLREDLLPGPLPARVRMLTIAPSPGVQPLYVAPLLAKALNTGDADLNRDGLLDFWELGEYLQGQLGTSRVFAHRRKPTKPLYLALTPYSPEVSNSAPPPVSVVGGAGGVGKSRLAREVAGAGWAVNVTNWVPDGDSDEDDPAADRADPPPPDRTAENTSAGEAVSEEAEAQEAAQYDQSSGESAEEPVDDDVDWVSDAPATTDLLRREALADVIALRLTEIHSQEPDSSLLVHLDGAWAPARAPCSTCWKGGWATRSW